MQGFNKYQNNLDKCIFFCRIQLISWSKTLYYRSGSQVGKFRVYVKKYYFNPFSLPCLVLWVTFNNIPCVSFTCIVQSSLVQVRGHFHSILISQSRRHVANIFGSMVLLLPGNCTGKSWASGLLVSAIKFKR